MVARLRGELSHIATIKADGEVMNVVGILLGMNSRSGKVDDFSLFIDMKDLTNTPGAAGDEGSLTPSLKAYPRPFPKGKGGNACFGSFLF